MNEMGPDLGGVAEGAAVESPDAAAVREALTNITDANGEPIAFSAEEMADLSEGTGELLETLQGYALPALTVLILFFALRHVWRGGKKRTQ